MPNLLFFWLDLKKTPPTNYDVSSRRFFVMQVIQNTMYVKNITHFNKYCQTCYHSKGKVREVVTSLGFYRNNLTI